MLNWPNVFTVFRMLCTVPFVVFLFDDSPFAPTAALGIYLVAVATDTIDGWLARRLNNVTDFGKIMDPLADKVIVVAALVSFVGLGLVPMWMVLAIVGRELVIMGFRAVAAARGIYIYASTLAKWKTAFQMAAIAFILGVPVARYWAGARWPAGMDPAAAAATSFTMWVAVVLTLATGLWYLWKNRQVVAGIFVR